MTLLARAGAALAAPTLLLCLLGAPPASAAEAPFRAAPDLALPLPASPRTVAAGDFDSDRRQDLAVAARRDQRDDGVTILRGTGDGGFTARTWLELPGRSVASSLAVGDFDGNAVADLAATGERYVSVRPGP